ncbi:hypothetical protein [Halosimplex halophilum]|uniref:hypothetical protein n=1 Tax=Halosimplex halophilum TaxID=2559572 RepID=UPI00107F882B|nr:hypothetical protein [Halosimplex halophilum]
MPFDIADRIRGGLGPSDDSGVSFEDVDRPDDVTVERVTTDLTNAVANGDLAVEDTGFDGESDLLGAVEPIVRDYREYHDSIDSLVQVQTAWESDTPDTDSGTTDEPEGDEVVEALDRHTSKIVSLLEGFGETEPLRWTRAYANRYPYFGCLVEYVFAYRELEDRDYFE